MATFRIPRYTFNRHGLGCCKETKCAPTAEQVARKRVRNLALCRQCRPGTLYRLQTPNGPCCDCVAKQTTKIKNKCGVGFACVERGPKPCTIAQPYDPCPCTDCASNVLPCPFPRGTARLGGCANPFDLEQS